MACRTLGRLKAQAYEGDDPQDETQEDNGLIPGGNVEVRAPVCMTKWFALIVLVECLVTIECWSFSFGSVSADGRQNITL